MTRSGFTSRMVRITSSNCVTSPRTTGAPIGTPPYGTAAGLRSMPVTDSPRATRRRMSRGPMKPVAPITRIAMRVSLPRGPRSRILRWRGDAGSWLAAAGLSRGGRHAAAIALAPGPSPSSTPSRARGRPEAVLPPLVALVFAELDRFPVLQTPDMDLRERRRHALALGVDRDQGDDEIVAAQHVVHVDAEGAGGQVHRVPEEAADLFVAGEVPRERAV